jgi:hypothetical protein
MYKIYIESKNTNKKYNISKLVTDISYTSYMSGTATKLEFTLIKDNVIVYHEGDAVSFYDNEIPIFYGYVFTKSINEKKEIKTSCYDQLRYLKSKQSFEFKGTSLKEIIETIANYFKLNVGYIENVDYKTSYRYHEDESIFDIIDYHVNQAMISTKRQIVFYDDFGKLSLKYAEDLATKYIIGVESVATSYEYKTDIDNETYNTIKFIRPNSAKKNADLYLAEDVDNVKKWGVLQYYQVFDENVNIEQLKEYLKMFFNYHNKTSRSLTIDAIGIPGLRGGSTVCINIPDIGDISITKLLLIDKVSHKYKNNDHTMNLELIVR